MDKDVEEAVDFFRSNKAYDKLFHLFRKKYESLGRIGGTVSVKKFSEQEMTEIAPFFGVSSNALNQKEKISLHSFEQQLQHTRFQEIPLKTLLDAYFGTTIVSNKARQAFEREALQQFLKEQMDLYPNIAFWFDYLMEYPKECRWMTQWFTSDKAYLQTWFRVLERAFSLLPQSAERLPMFSQRVTGDPHAFDVQTQPGKMFLYLLAVHQAKQQEGVVSTFTSTEEINKLLQAYLIYREDLLNYVTCANLLAETEAGVHPVWKAAVEMQTVQIVPLKEIVNLVRAYPAQGQKVWVVENSGVCSTLLDDFPQVPIVCTNGQFTLATWMLLDLLEKNDCHLYYASDFDPEGLMMAQRLLTRYPDTLHLWQMTVPAYRTALSSKEISEGRLEQIKQLTHPALIEIGKRMQEMKRAGYQEALVTNMRSDLTKEMGTQH